MAGNEIDATATTPLVSVVIPTYNRASMVGSAIASVLRQTIDNLEVIVVDDGSTDDTENAVKGLKDDRIRYIRHAVNKRLPATRNTGIANARGRYIAFLDDDDQWGPDKLRRQLDAIQDCDAVLCASTVTGSKPTHRYRREWVTSNDLRKGNVFDPSALLVRAEMFRDMQFDTTLPNGIGEDWDIFIRIAERGKIRYISEPLVLYNDSRQHERITNRQARMSIADMEPSLRIVEKHRVFFGPFWSNVHVADTLLSYIGGRTDGKLGRIFHVARRCGVSAVVYVLLRRACRRLNLC